MGQHFSKVLLLFCILTFQLNCSQKKTKTFCRHRSPVLGIKIFDQNRVLSFCAKEFLLWDIKQRQSENVIIGMESLQDNVHLEDVEKVNENNIASICTNGVVKLWNMQKGENSKLEIEEGKLCNAGNINKLDEKTIFVHNRGIFSLFDIAAQKFLTKFGKKYEPAKQREKKNSYCKLSPNELLSLHRCKIYLWDVRKQKKAHKFWEYEGDKHHLPVRNIYKIDENTFVATDELNSIKLWDTRKKECMQTFLGHENPIKKIINLNEKKMVSTSCDKIVVWNKKTGNNRYIKTKVKLVEKLDNKKMLYAQQDGSIKILDTKNLEEGEKSENILTGLIGKYKNDVPIFCVHQKKNILSANTEKIYIDDLSET